MRSIAGLLLVSAFLVYHSHGAAGMASPQASTVAERLGYPADAKLLLIRADPIGLSHGVNRAAFPLSNDGNAT